MKVLDLVLKGQWYDMIDRGEKKEEYREERGYWIKRLTELKSDYLPFKYFCNPESIPFKGYTHVRFHRAYTNTTMLFELDGMDYGIGNSSWGAPDKKVFIIKLGSRIE